MKRTILIFGIIGGLIVSTLMITSLAILKSEEMGETGMWIGYTTMLIAFSMIYVGIKNYRDNHQDGYISFGKALKIGLLITLIASTMYVITWEIYYTNFAPDFMEKYTTTMLDKQRANGASAEEIKKLSSDMEEYKEMYKNPLMVICLTYMEILPVGILVSLISAGVLKRRPKVHVAV